MSERELNIVVGQINPIVGDLEYNTNKIIRIIKKHPNADIIVFPEMSLVGYPLMDHILDPLIFKKNLNSLERLKTLNSKSTIIVGTFTSPSEISKNFHPYYNSAVIIKGKEIIYIENKRLLPNYDIFDERRYFSFDNKFKPIKIQRVKVGILICEDIWDKYYEKKVVGPLVEQGSEVLIAINASPYYINKFNLRRDLVVENSKKFSIPIVYVNMVGGLDEIVFDGQSFITNKFGQIIFKSKPFMEDISSINLKIDDVYHIEEKSYNTNWRENVVNALKLNLYDYYYKSNIFDGIVLGLSGGIDSAFTTYICAKSLGADKVNAIMMPTRFTSQQSIDDAEHLCRNLNVNYIIHPIDHLFKTYELNLEEYLGKREFSSADENLQSRIRATILMYYSNKFNWLLVSTGNKSEIGVGYCTLYGDTNGGKNIPGDLLKGQIYDICEYINQEKEIIPRSIIERPPTAELRENQKDSDSLPPYEILDVILEEIIKNGISNDFSRLKDKGIALETILRVTKLYLNSEFKRRQLVQSVKVSESAFGIGRRYPVLKRLKL